MDELNPNNLENFDKIELQRFLSLWWVGHILDAVKQQSPYFSA